MKFVETNRLESERNEQRPSAHGAFALLAFATILTQGPLPLRADIRLPKIFSPHMVLQRDIPVPVWGWAADGERVTVSIAGQTATTVAAGGKWSIVLQPLKLGAPLTMTVAGKNSIELSEVLVGDVWVSCGQSNMMMGLGATDGGAERVAHAGDFPNLRLFNAEGNPAADTQAADLGGGAWRASDPNSAAGFSAVSQIFGRSLSEHLKVPIGMVNVVAIVPAESWVDRKTLDADPMLATAARSPLGGGRSYNSLIAPLQPFAIKGVIYYQGEYNAGRAHEYRRLLPALIQSWRTTWNQGDFPFLIVQLPGFSEHKAEKDKRLDMPPAALAALHQPGSESSWAEMREAQMTTATTVPKTGIAVTIDLGDPQDIHPKNKAPVAERLALAARAVAYGEKLVSSGPTFDKLTVDQGKVIVRFSDIGGGLVARAGPLAGFELGRSDGTCVFADAQIRGDTVVLSSPDAPSPVAVRYAWANFPRCTLFNAEGLPAAPFRAYVADHAQTVDSFTIPLNNPGFEQAADAVAANSPNWILKKGAQRTDTRTSEGKYALRLPVGGEASQDDIVPRAATRYDWNSDPLERVNFRPGYVAGYSIDIAAGPGTTEPARAYLRLCGHSTAEAYQYWGGVPEITTAGQNFVTRQIAVAMTSTFDMGGSGAGVGVLLAYLPGDKITGELLLDNLSPVTILRPKLTVSDVTPIDLGVVAPGAAATSAPRTISNGQTRTLADHRNDASPKPAGIATILYGTANLRPGPFADSEHVRGATDDVGAILIGDHPEAFEFISPHRGASLRELKLLGINGQSGLRGGSAPESEALVVRFNGASKPGTYTANIRIITQAANVGRRSEGKPGEPPEAFYYLDIPVTARVGS